MKLQRRILHLGDLHFDEFATLAQNTVVTSDGFNAALRDRLQATILLIDHAADQGPLAGIVIPGDVFHRAHPTPNEMRAAATVLAHGAQKCAAGKVLVLAGNHDETRNTRDATALAGVDLAPFVIAVERPAVLEYAGILWACLPYVRRSSVREQANVQGRVTERDFYTGAVRALGLSLHASLQEQQFQRRMSTDSAVRGPVNLPWALAYHGAVEGAMVGVQPRSLEGDIELPIEIIDAYPAALLGHIHRQQAIGRNGRYSGSQCIHDFGEADELKGGVVWTFDDAAPDIDAAAEFLSIDAILGRPLRAWTTWDIPSDLDPADVESTCDAIDEMPSDGSVNRFRGSLPEPQVLAVRGALRRYTARGGICADELVIQHENRMRDAAIGRERLSDAELVQRALATRQIEGSRADRILAHHAEIEQGGA